MEFLTVNHRCPSREMPFKLGAINDGCFHRLAPRLLGENSKIVKFLLSLNIHKRDFEYKQTAQNIEICPESLGAMLEY